VLLIHLANLPGEANFNIMRMMKMLVGLQLMVVSAATATVQGTVGRRQLTLSHPRRKRLELSA
jgi:hypothetical protein